VTAVIRAEMNGYVTRHDDGPGWMYCYLQYASTDPYAVSFDTVDSPDPDRPWRFARDLLDAGLDAPSGLHEVRVWPDFDGNPQRVGLALSSSDGEMQMWLPRDEVVRLLRRTFVAVPRGWESRHVDVDGAVARILEGVS
jgi:hypothetical protein